MCITLHANFLPIKISSPAGIWLTLVCQHGLQFGRQGAPLAAVLILGDQAGLVTLIQFGHGPDKGSLKRFRDSPWG